MDHLIAKVKGHQEKRIFKLVSDKAVFDMSTENMQLVNYEPDHNLDEEAWFQIENFSEKPFCINFLKNKFVSSEYNDIPADKFNEIAYLCAIQKENFLFQKITRSLYVTRKMLRFGEKVSIEEDTKRLFIKNIPDAIYIKKTDTLVFRNLATISSIFKGIDELYKEATKEEVIDFLKQPFIKLRQGYCEDKVSKPNRKRIALAMSSLSKMSITETTQLVSYINGYSSDKLNFDPTKRYFDVKSDDELKHLLYGIGQQFYTTIIGEEKRLANSIQKF